MKKIVLILTLIVSLLGCGSASNNDQGVTFTLFGFYADSSGEVGLTGTSLRFSEISDTEPSSSTTGTFSNVVYLGMQNNLSGQLIRTSRVYYTFLVPGASVQPPSTNGALVVTLGPTNNTAGSSLPPSLVGNTTAASTHFSGVSIIPVPIREWLNLHRGELPAAPFDIEATVYVRGSTSSGDELNTNPATLIVKILPDVIIPPTPGADTPAS